MTSMEVPVRSYAAIAGNRTENPIELQKIEIKVLRNDKARWGGGGSNLKLTLPQKETSRAWKRSDVWNAVHH